jgi:hypothetical protein
MRKCHAISLEPCRSKPDFILLQLYINDFEKRGMERPQPYMLLPAALDRELEKSSVLYDLLNQQWANVQPARPAFPEPRRRC